MIKKSLSCIFEDKENNSSVCVPGSSNQLGKDFPLQNKKRQVQLICKSSTKQLCQQEELLYVDTISDISKRDSIHRFSMGSEMTHSNNYKILVMNVRNVFEKKLFQHLMIGFNSIKYHVS